MYGSGPPREVTQLSGERWKNCGRGAILRPQYGSPIELALERLALGPLARVLLADPPLAEDLLALPRVHRTHSAR